MISPAAPAAPRCPASAIGLLRRIREFLISRIPESESNNFLFKVLSKFRGTLGQLGQLSNSNCLAARCLGHNNIIYGASKLIGAPHA